MSLEKRAELVVNSTDLVSADACQALRVGSDGKIHLATQTALGFHSNRNLNNGTWDTDSNGSQDIPFRSATITNPSTCRGAIVILKVWHGKLWFRDTANVGDFTIRYYPRMSHNTTTTPPATPTYDINYSIGYMHPVQNGRDVWAEFDLGYTDRVIPIAAGGSVSVTVGGLFAVPRPTAVVSTIQYYLRKESLSMVLINT